MSETKLSVDQRFGLAAADIVQKVSKSDAFPVVPWIELNSARRECRVQVLSNGITGLELKLWETGGALQLYLSVNVYIGNLTSEHCELLRIGGEVANKHGIKGMNK